MDTGYWGNGVMAQVDAWQDEEAVDRWTYCVSCGLPEAEHDSDPTKDSCIRLLQSYIKLLLAKQPTVT